MLILHHIERKGDMTVFVMEPSPLLHVHDIATLRKLVDSHGRAYEYDFVYTQKTVDNTWYYSFEFENFPVPPECCAGSVFYLSPQTWKQNLPCTKPIRFCYTIRTHLVQNDADYKTISFPLAYGRVILIENAGIVSVVKEAAAFQPQFEQRNYRIAPQKAEDLFSQLLSCILSPGSWTEPISDDTSRSLCFTFEDKTELSFSGVFFDDQGRNTDMLIRDFLDCIDLTILRSEG